MDFWDMPFQHLSEHRFEAIREPEGGELTPLMHEPGCVQLVCVDRSVIIYGYQNLGRIKALNPSRILLAANCKEKYTNTGGVIIR